MKELSNLKFFIIVRMETDMQMSNENFPIRPSFLHFTIDSLST